jgi:hypothetical protein
MIGHPKHVKKALDAGVDIICAQGGEGGGHTGSYALFMFIHLIFQCPDVHPYPRMRCLVRGKKVLAQWPTHLRCRRRGNLQRKVSCCLSHVIHPGTLTNSQRLTSLGTALKPFG